MSLFFAIWTAAGFTLTFAAALVVIVSNPKATLNRLFCGFALAIAALNAFEFMMKIADSPARALVCFNLHVIAWFSFVGLLTHFSIVLARREHILKNKIGYLLIYGPIPVIGALNWSTRWFYQGVTLQPWGYTQQFAEYYWILSVYSVLFFLSLIYFAGVAWRQAKNEREIKQDRIIFFSFVVTFMPTLLIELLTKPLGLALPPLIVQMATVIVVFFGYAIIRYGLLVITPADLATDILSLMPDMMAFADNYQRITVVNSEIVKRLGYAAEGMIGADARILFADAAEYAAFREAVQRERIIKQRLVRLKLTGGISLPVDVSGALVKDRFGEEIGMLFVFRDVAEREQLLTEQKRMIEELSEAKQKMADMLNVATGARTVADQRLLDANKANAELEDFHEVAVGRELKMIELEKEIDSLRGELGRDPKYK